jgi:hypothetical protein
MRSSHRLCLAAVVSLLAASTVARAADPLKPCALLTPQAAAALYGAPLGPPFELRTACFYKEVNGPDTKGLTLTLIITHAASSADVRPVFDTLIPKDPGTVTEPVAGLGDKALFVTTNAGKSITLYVLARGNILEITANSSPNPNIKSGLKDAARQILAKP